MTQEQINKLQELKKLLDAGILTEEEMQTEKAKILGTAKVEQKETTANKESSAPEMTKAEDFINDNYTNIEPVVDQTEASGNSNKRNIFLAIVGIAVIGLFVWAISSKNEPKETYNDPTYAQIEDVDDRATPITETNENERNVSDATNTDDDEFAFDPWSGTLRLDGGIYRTCDTRTFLHLQKVSSGMYEGNITILAGSVWDENSDRFDPSWGTLEGKVRAKADGNVLTVVLDAYTTKAGDDGNYYEGINYKGQILRISYAGSSYSAKAIGDMEGLFMDGECINVTK